MLGFGEVVVEGEGEEEEAIVVRGLVIGDEGKRSAFGEIGRDSEFWGF